MLSNCESTASQYYVMYGAGAVFFLRLRQKSAQEPAPAPQRWILVRYTAGPQFLGIYHLGVLSFMQKVKSQGWIIF